MATVLSPEQIQKGLPTISDRNRVRRFVRQQLATSSHVWYASFYGSSLWKTRGARTLASDIDVFIVFANDPIGTPNYEGTMLLQELMAYAAKYNVPLSLESCDAWQLEKAAPTIMDGGFYDHLLLAHRRGGGIKAEFHGGFDRWVGSAVNQLSKSPVENAFSYLSRQAKWLTRWRVNSDQNPMCRYEMLTKLISNHLHIKRRMLESIAVLPPDNQSNPAVERFYHGGFPQDYSQLGLELSGLKDLYISELQQTQEVGFDLARYTAVLDEIEEEGIPRFSRFVSWNTIYLQKRGG